MADRKMPSPDELRQLLRYEPETGALYWRQRPAHFFDCAARHLARVMGRWNVSWAGKEAGTIGPYGYRMVTIFNRHFAAHRIAWCITHGQWPSEQIDHVNGQRDDNRLSNLRAATHAQNQRNMRISRSNTSGVTGVYWCRRTNRWKAEISLRSRKVYVGVFRDLAAAEAAIRAKRSELGFSDRHGREGPDYDRWRAQG